MNTKDGSRKETRKQLLREYFLNACLLAMAKQTTSQSAVLDCLESSGDDEVARVGEQPVNVGAH